MNRRLFIKSGAISLVTLGLSPSFLQRTVFGMGLPYAVPKGKTLICLFQRGAADALSMLVPHGEEAYYVARPNISIPTPGAKPGAAIDLDGFFGLHPSLAPFKTFYDQKLFAPVTAVGSPHITRSHFDAQDFMESGTPGVKSTPDGWLNRLLATSGTCEECNNPFRAVSMTPQTPRILEGAQETVAMSTLNAFTVRAQGSDVQRLEALYRTGSADLVHGKGSDMFDAVKRLRELQPQKYAAQNGADYPKSPFGSSLRQIAQLIKADAGLEVAFADVGGWDTHVNQGSSQGQLANRLSDFSKSIEALVQDLGDRMNDVVIITMSEFGRIVKENGTRGTDHGHAGAIFVLGGGINGGKVHGKWPGLAPEQLHENRDLALTTDFRSVFSEIAAMHLGTKSTEKIFPGFSVGKEGWLGLMG